MVFHGHSHGHVVHEVQGRRLILANIGIYKISRQNFADLLFLETQYIEYQVVAKSEEGFALFTFSNCPNIRMFQRLGLFVSHSY
jgi:hypothetical protein